MSFYESYDPVFETYVMGNAPLKQISTGYDWVEGPVWFGDAGYLLFSDIPSNRIMRWTPDGHTGIFRQPSNFSNGHTRDLQGRLISCEHGTRRVTRTELDCVITVIADSYDGKRLNSPNDVIVKSDGTIWFTDPHYGIMTNYEGYQSEQELACCVYRVDVYAGSIEQVVTNLDCPNGLAFSPDESKLYVADTGKMFDPDAQRHIYAYTFDERNQLESQGVFHTVSPGASDGFRVDSDGNVWSSAADGVHCISPSGKSLGKIYVPEPVSNVCFGGRAKHQLFITASTSVYSIILNRRGIQHP